MPPQPNQVPQSIPVNTKIQPVASAFDVVQRLLMVFIFILTICMFSYWGYEAVMYVLSVSFNVETGYTAYDMFIGVIAMLASAALFAGSAIWWKKNLKAEMFLKLGTAGFIIKDILEIPNAIVPLTKVAVVTRLDLTSAAGAIGYDLFKIGFWVFALVIFIYAIKNKKNGQ